jgi:hypothetical protein
MRLIAWSACLGLGLAGAAAAGRGAQVPPASDNTELTRMYQEDQDDRKPGLHGIDWSVVGPRDLARLKRTRELYQAGSLRTAADWLHAALILQHKSDADDYLLAHEMCVAALANGEQGAKWLSAATEDRFLRSIGRKQRFGTQYEAAAEPGKFKLADTDSQVTDELRSALGAPSLAEAAATASRFDKK